ncbi:MAG: metallo-mystery pair system four-Cys motif protein [Rhodoferax sp.]|nr:MAG: metallo-mystery pair system four-Cys motif protein [Rhodoferax sp.]
MKNSLATLTAVAAAGLLSACANQGAGLSATSQPVSIAFAAQINGEAFACGSSYKNVGTTKSTITPSDFRFYVSDVALINSKGEAVPVNLTQDGVWQLENIAMLDFENGTGPCRNGTSGTNMAVKGAVPADTYTGVQFTVGVPFKRNHADPTIAPSPLNNTAMFWNWQGGYKFIKFDAASSGMQKPAMGAGSEHGNAAASGFSVHLGSTVCAGASKTEAPSACQNPNRMTIKFDKFDAAKGVVVADMGAVLAGANVDVNSPGTSPGCMSFPKDGDCPPVMNALGLAYDGKAATGAQKLFSQR